MFRSRWSLLWILAVPVLAACAGEGDDLEGDRGDAIKQGRGALDESYGQGGKCTTSIVPKQFVFASGSFVVEQIGAKGDQSIDIVKVTPGSGADNQFAKGGHLRIPNRQGEWSVEVVNLAPRASSGFFVALGMMRKSPDEMRGKIVAYRDDGSVDSSFASAGVLETEGRPRIEAVDAKGRLLVTLYDFEDESTVRFDSKGSIDASFWAIVKPAVGDTALSLDSKGRILFNTPEGLKRYLDSGRVDPSFGTNGSAFSGGYDRAKHKSSTIRIPGRDDLRVSLPIAADANGGVYVAASKGQSGGVVHLVPSGKIDSAFGDKGFVKFQTDSSTDVRAFTLDKQRRLLVGYRHSKSGFGVNIDFGIARLNAEGTFDPSFDGDGLATAGFGSSFSDNLSGLFEDRAGRILAAGTSPGGDSNSREMFVSARFIP